MKKSLMYQKPPSQRPPTPSQSKPAKPRPEFTTDFTDYSKYRLTQQQMNQKKASLESKNRDIARAQLEQRRKKLAMGIIDDETKKVYEEAFKSKGIDLNPPLRRNLSQMISYQKQMRQSMVGRSSSRERPSNNNNTGQNMSRTNNMGNSSNNFSIDAGRDSIEKELKHTKQFIKKVERASKVKDINRAVDILESDSPYIPYNPTQSSISSSRPEKSRNSNQTINTKESLTPLEGLRDTLNFMEQKLFKRTLDDPASKELQKKQTLQYTPILQNEDFQTQRSNEQNNTQVSFSQDMFTSITSPNDKQQMKVSNKFTPGVNTKDKVSEHTEEQQPILGIMKYFQHKPRQESRTAKINPVQQQKAQARKNLHLNFDKEEEENRQSSLGFGSPLDQRYIENGGQSSNNTEESDWLHTIQRMNNLLEKKEKEFNISNNNYHEQLEQMCSPLVKQPQSRKEPQQQKQQKQKPQLLKQKLPFYSDQNIDLSNIPNSAPFQQQQASSNTSKAVPLVWARDDQPKMKGQEEKQKDKISQASSRRNFEEEIDFSLTINNDDSPRDSSSLRIDTDNFFFDDSSKLKTSNKHIGALAQTYIDNTTSIKKHGKTITGALSLCETSSPQQLISTAGLPALVQESDPDDDCEERPPPLSNLQLKKTLTFGAPNNEDFKKKIQSQSQPSKISYNDTYQQDEVDHEDSYPVSNNTKFNNTQMTKTFTTSKHTPITNNFIAQPKTKAPTVTVSYNSQVLPSRSTVTNNSRPAQVSQQSQSIPTKASNSQIMKIKQLLEDTKKGLESIQIPDFNVPLVPLKNTSQKDSECISLKRVIR